jgi:hypothetical protein
LERLRQATPIHSPDAYVQLLLEQLSGAPAAQALSAGEWEQAFDEWVEGSPDVPHLPDEALTRD